MRVLAFATHELVPGDLDGLTQPALALSAPSVTGEAEYGLLTLGEILGLRLDADWVVLSACNTGSADGVGSEAVSGLGWAFFYAGSRALLVANWLVETTSAKALTTELFRQQAQSGSTHRAKALDVEIDGRSRLCPSPIGQAGIQLCASNILGAVLGRWGWGWKQARELAPGSQH